MYSNLWYKIDHKTKRKRKSWVKYKKQTPKKKNKIKVFDNVGERLDNMNYRSVECTMFLKVYIHVVINKT